MFLIFAADKLQQQLPHWLRGRFSECSGRWTTLNEVVQQVQNELFSGLSEPCVASLLIQVIPIIYTTARIEDTSLKPGQRYYFTSHIIFQSRVRFSIFPDME